MFAAYKPALFLQRIIIKSGVSTHEELVGCVREAMDDHEHTSEEEYRIHADRFEAWCIGVMLDQVPKVGVEINPFDEVLRVYSDEYHISCLGSKVTGPTNQGTSNARGPSNETIAALDLLAKSVSVMKEENESTADVLSKQLDIGAMVP